MDFKECALIKELLTEQKWFQEYSPIKYKKKFNTNSR